MGIPTVMIVEDEKGLLSLLGHIVEQLECLTVLASGGAEAIKLLQDETPNVMILDLAMPGVSGRDVLAFVRNTPRLADMRVVVLTARPNIVPDVEALGYDALLVKPVNVQELHAVVETMLSM